MTKPRKELRTEAVIHASAARIWEILMDFNSYANWNPFIFSINGKQAVGSTLTVKLQLPDGMGMTMRPKVIAVKDNQEFRWKGRLLIPGLFDGEHIFELRENNELSTTFIQRELFSGILVPLFRNLIDVKTRIGFEAMNKQLKDQAEKIT
ncbi:MAG: SRPBCC domain-containing protein [Bacteroidales bacterium]|nr:SRPBCC domain-containing protein [Bacteroidales bacterium]